MASYIEFSSSFKKFLLSDIPHVRESEEKNYDMICPFCNSRNTMYLYMWGLLTNKIYVLGFHCGKCGGFVTLKYLILKMRKIYRGKYMCYAKIYEIELSRGNDKQVYRDEEACKILKQVFRIEKQETILKWLKLST